MYKVMKKNILYIMSLAVALVSCSSDDIMGDGDSLSSKSIAFELSTGPVGKATTTNFRTSFEVGDEAGVYVVKNGSVVKENVKLTFSSYGYWVADESFDYATYGDADFYAYYPFADDASFDASTAFEDYVKDFEPQLDQSTADGYEVSDLMTSAATKVDASSRTVKMQLKHDMTLVCMELPNKSYSFTNEGVKAYTISKAEDATFKYGNAVIVPSIDDATQQYRFLVNPTSTDDIIISYTNNGTGTTATVTDIAEIGAGNYHVEKVDGGVQLLSWTLQVGDFYMNDGTLVAKGTTLTAEQKENVLGVVYQIGTSESVTTANENWSHAMVVGLTKTQNTWAPAINPDDPTTTALTSADNSAGWKSWYTNFGLNHLVSNNASASKIVIDELEEEGYKNTTNWDAVPNIISRNNAPKITNDTKKNFATVFQSVYSAQKNEKPTPASLCSAWYVPSLAAWMDMKNGDLTTIENAISAAGGEALGISSKLSVPYWSSNLRGHETMWGFTADGTTADKLFTSLDMRKNSRYYRFILAF